MRISSYLLFFFIINYPFNGHANDDYCSINQLGWHFYCDPKKEDVKEQKDNILNQFSTAKEAIEAIRADLDEKKAKAVLNPTSENVAEYIATQNQQVERAERFSAVWKKVLWNNPHLDFSVKTPINSIGSELTTEIKYKNISKSIQKIREQYGIFFFYGSKCPYCHKYSPILRAFALNHGLEVQAVSLDGGVLPEWPNSLIDRGQAARMGMRGKPVPATMLFDSKKKQLIPLGFGILSMSELEERMYLLIKGEENHE